MLSRNALLVVGHAPMAVQVRDSAARGGSRSPSPTPTPAHPSQQSREIRQGTAQRRAHRCFALARVGRDLGAGHAEQLRHQHANARSNFGRHWLAAGDPARAIPVLQQAVSDYGEAERLGARLRDERQLPNALLLLAHASAGADRPELAVDALQQRQKVHPEPRPAMAELGERLHLTGSAAFQALLATIPQ